MRYLCVAKGHDLPDLSLFHPLVESDLSSWARSLVYFRICTSRGGLGDDNGTWMEARVRYTSERDLIYLLSSFGLSLAKMPPAIPHTPIKSTPYYDLVTSDASLPVAIETLPTYQQIGHCKVGEDSCFLWACESSLRFRFGTNWTVTAEDVARARRFEKHLHQLADRIVDPPIDSECCLCPKHHAYLWSEHATD